MASSHVFHTSKMVISLMPAQDLLIFLCLCLASAVRPDASMTAIDQSVARRRGLYQGAARNRERPDDLWVCAVLWVHVPAPRVPLSRPCPLERDPVVHHNRCGSVSLFPVYIKHYCSKMMMLAPDLQLMHAQHFLAWICTS